jgi:uncharacterized membrane protein YheB (UPF0754 family)
MLARFFNEINFMNYWLLIIPFISAFIGWITNWLAIKMLFHPKKPIYILGFTLQGIFPKRQQQFAEKLGKLVSNELLSFNDIQEKITNPHNVKKLMPVIDEHLENFLRNKLAEQMPIISMFIGDKTIQQLKNVFAAELEALFPVIMNSYMKNLQQDLDLEKIVIEKVQSFSSDKLEDLLQAIMKKEFKFIELLGGVIGFILGLLQIGITLISR